MECFSQIYMPYERTFFCHFVGQIHWLSLLYYCLCSFVLDSVYQYSIYLNMDIWNLHEITSKNSNDNNELSKYFES